MMATRQSGPSEHVVEFLSSSLEETQAFGEQLGRVLHPGDVLALFGDLGSGKTTLIQGIARGLGGPAEMVKSPTFVLQREYPGVVPLIHIDGYRLEGVEQVVWLDTDLMFSKHKVTAIEWAERFGELVPEDHLEIRLAHVSTNRRRLVLQATGLCSTERVNELQEALKKTETRAVEGS